MMTCADFLSARAGGGRAWAETWRPGTIPEVLPQGRSTGERLSAYRGSQTYFDVSIKSASDNFGSTGPDRSNRVEPQKETPSEEGVPGVRLAAGLYGQQVGPQVVSMLIACAQAWFWKESPQFVPIWLAPPHCDCGIPPTMSTQAWQAPLSR